MEKTYHHRIKRVLKDLTYQGSALLLGSAPESLRSRDTFYQYRQNSDFYYLTGSLSKELVLLLSPKDKSPNLILAPRPDKTKILWEGKGEDPKHVAKRIGAKLIITRKIRDEVLSRLKGVDGLLYQNIPQSFSWSIAKTLMETLSHGRGSYPKRFAHSDLVLEPMRLIKDQYEIDLISKAARITNLALGLAAPLIVKGRFEYEVAATVDYAFRMHDCCPSFNTIVAAGPSASTLHYENGKRKFRSGDIVLLDLGAEYRMYAADITRAVPVDGSFNKIQRKIYACVLEAQKDAISKIKDGVLIKTVYDAAARTLTEGLVDLRVLRGRIPNLIKKQAYKPYFPHGIGHSLGLDVHDVGKHRGNNEARLHTGMVFTIEPGLYFSKKTGSIPPCGVRIEDDVLVKKDGADVLSEGFPKKIEDLETFLESLKRF